MLGRWMAQVEEMYIYKLKLPGADASERQAQRD
jgi:hypothetical protein